MSRWSCGEGRYQEVQRAGAHGSFRNRRTDLVKRGHTEREILGDPRVGKPGFAEVKYSGLHRLPDEPSHWGQEQLN